MFFVKKVSFIKLMLKMKITMPRIGPHFHSVHPPLSAGVVEPLTNFSKRGRGGGGLAGSQFLERGGGVAGKEGGDFFQGVGLQFLHKK